MGLDDSDSTIDCAHCGHNHCGHFVKTEVYVRDCEDGPAIAVHAAHHAHRVMIDRGSAPNRRDTVRVYCRCEACERLTCIEIEEHKGQLALTVSKGA